MSQRHVWLIEVADWGSIFFEGTESQAEEWRQHKAMWEGCVATKRRASPEEIKTALHIDKAEDLGVEEGIT